MEKVQVSDYLCKIERIKKSVSKTAAKRLQLNKCSKIMKKLYSLNSNCEECHNLITELDRSLTQLDSFNISNNQTVTNFKQILYAISSHLQEEHYVKSPIYYLKAMLPFGVVLGILIGIFIFELVWFGLLIGMAIGISLGVGFDAEHKRKGLTW